MTRRRKVRERKRRNKRDRWLRGVVGVFPNRPARRSFARFFWRDLGNTEGTIIGKLYFVNTSRGVT